MSQPGTPAIDRRVLDQLERSVGDDRQFVRELVETFRDDSRAQLAAMREALAADDPDSLRRAAHTLKSNGASIGAMELGELCRQLEKLALTSGEQGRLVNSASLGARVEAIADEFERAAVELDQLVPPGAA